MADQPGVDEPRWPIMSDRPVEVMDPVRKLRLLGLVWAAVIVVAAAAAAYTATVLANRSTDQHVERVLAEMDRRTAENRRAQGRALRVLEQNRRTICVILAKHRAEGQPDAAVLWDVYGCQTSADPVVPPGWTPPPGWPPLPGAADVEPTPTPPAGPPADATIAPPGPDQPTQHPPVTPG